jgi:hypothetical protein
VYQSKLTKEINQVRQDQTIPSKPNALRVVALSWFIILDMDGQLATRMADTDFR